MTDNATYHKIETEADASSDAGHEDGLLSEGLSRPKKLDWVRWVRPACEALLVVIIAVLAYKLLVDNKRLLSRGSNEPQHQCM